MKTLCITIFLFFFAFSVSAYAQQTDDEDPLGIEGDWTYAQASTSTNDCTGETQTTYFMTEPNIERNFKFMVLEQGEYIVRVGSTDPDLLYTRTAENEYAGTLLMPIEGLEYETALTIVRSNRIHEVGTFTAYECIGQLDIEYMILTRENLPSASGLWTESERTVTDDTLIEECLPEDVRDLYRSLLFRPDPLLTLLFVAQDEAVVFGRILLMGDGTVFEYEEESGGLAQQFTLTRVSDTEINYQLTAAFLRNRECHYAYESTFTPFDGDYDDLMTIVDDILAAEQTAGE